MISIIVSSYKEEYFERLKKNISETIGVSYEIIRIWNPNSIGICEAYNRGASQAVYPYLCFCHEDMVFNTTNWGTIAVEHFNINLDLGLIGVAGSAYKPYMLSGWGSAWGSQSIYYYLNQADQVAKRTEEVRINIKEGIYLNQTVTVDGCFLFTTRKVYSEITFDDRTFKGYHCYDVDYSIQVGLKYKVGVISNILITHLSLGSYDYTWLEDTVQLHKKWKKKLPLKVGSISKSESLLCELGAFQFVYEKVLLFNKGARYLSLFSLSGKFITLVGLLNWIRLNSKLLASLTGAKIGRAK
ncbi:MAG: glycosyltransferase family protein [Bacteroidota bacterium]|nr:glycosyltransferase family protein [Bacteroidota bacterium]